MGKERSTLHMIFSATYYLESHNAIYFKQMMNSFPQVGLSMLYHVEDNQFDILSVKYVCMYVVHTYTDA